MTLLIWAHSWCLFAVAERASKVQSAGISTNSLDAPPRAACELISPPPHFQAPSSGERDRSEVQGYRRADWAWSCTNSAKVFRVFLEGRVESDRPRIGLGFRV